MEKEQLIKEVLAYIDNLYEAKVEPPQSQAIFGDNRIAVMERWQPREFGQYWIFDNDGNPAKSEWDGYEIDYARHSFGNCFPTKEAAQAASDKVKALLLSL